MYAPLTQLLSEDRVLTGGVKSGGTPYVTIEREGSENERTSDSDIETIDLNIEIVSDSLPEAQEIARVMRPLFNRADFIWSDGYVLDMRAGGQSETQDENKAWHVKCAYEVLSRKAIEVVQ